MNLIDLAALSEKWRNIISLIEKKPGRLEEIENLLDISSASLRFHIKNGYIPNFLRKKGENISYREWQ